MADTDLIADNTMENGDDFGDEADDGLSMVSRGFFPSQEELLSPLARLQKHWDSDNVFNRQMVARNLLDTLRSIYTHPEDREDGLKALVCLSEDIEPMVRSELMEQIPHLAMFCSDNKQYFPNTIQDTILPTVVRYLTDTNNQVRKTSQAALLVLLEQELIDQSDVVDQVCPVIIQLCSTESSDDYRTEAVALMSKVAPLTGKDITERFFLPHFTAVCKDSHFHLRKVCAANIGDICNVVGQASTESELLPRFESLCEDGVWGVRKSCAECFMSVSWAVSSLVRTDSLSPLFVKLLSDQSRWVRMAAFQNLGPFISTFADPLVSGGQLIYNPDGTVHISIVDSEENGNTAVVNGDPNHNCESNNTLCLSNTERFEIQRETGGPHSSRSMSSSSCQASTENTAHPAGADSGNTPHPVGADSNNCVRDDEDDEFNSFIYWRHPVAVVSDRDENVDNDSERGVVSSSVSKENQSSSSIAENGSNRGITDDDDDGSQSIESESLISNPTLTANVLSPDYSKSPSKEQLNSVISSASFNLVRPIDQGGEDIHPLPDSGSQEPNPEERTAAPLPGDNPSSPDTTDDKTEERTERREGSPPSDMVSSVGASLSPSDMVSSISAGLSRLETGPGTPPLSDAQDRMQPSSSSSSSRRLPIGDTVLQSAGVNVHRAELSESVFQTETVSNIGTMHVIGASLDDKEVEFVNGLKEETPQWSQVDCSPDIDDDDESMTPVPRLQNVIPSQLLEQYLSMTDPTRAQTVDTEIAKHCAFSLPGVALTLGRRNWPCLKEVYDTLASDMQWKVRRTLAFSIHEMALILGDEITALDLVPIFNGFLKDLDEVRIGVLKHFADFVKLLRPELRQQYLNRMTDFLTTDNQRNWRFRLELAEQLVVMCAFYSPKEVHDNIFHIAIELACDRVADVRFMAYKLVSGVIKIITSSCNSDLTERVVQELQTKFAESSKWCERQAYVHICQNMIEDRAVNFELFAAHFLPCLLNLSEDGIPNVRITLARTLAQNIMPLVYFRTDENPNRERLMEVLSNLAEDDDADVGYYSRLAPPIGQSNIPEDELPV